MMSWKVNSGYTTVQVILTISVVRSFILHNNMTESPTDFVRDTGCVIIKGSPIAEIK